jgi:hypothetical protein
LIDESTMNKDSRSGSLTSDLSVKAIVGTTSDDEQLITALVNRILSKVLSLLAFGCSINCGLVIFWNEPSHGSTRTR